RSYGSSIGIGSHELERDQPGNANLIAAFAYNSTHEAKEQVKRTCEHPKSHRRAAKAYISAATTHEAARLALGTRLANGYVGGMPDRPGRKETRRRNSVLVLTPSRGRHRKVWAASGQMPLRR